jgi:hypothetical protein
MRCGCGCLIVSLLLVALLGGAVWLARDALREPALARVGTTATDARQAQQKIFSIVSGSARGRRVVLSEAELNAFLARNLAEAADVSLSDVRVDLANPDRVRLAGQTTLGRLLGEPPLTAVQALLPELWLARPVWIELVAKPATESGERRRYLRLDVQQMRIGRLRVPAVFARLLLEPGALRLLRWPLPQAIEEITIEPGRAVVRTAS